jgi:hypothetical protein
MKQKIIIGLIALAGITSGAQAQNATDIAGINYNDKAVSKDFSVLPLNSQSRSFVLNELEDKYNVGLMMLSARTNPKEIADVISNYSAVFVNADYLQDEDQRLNAYLAEAYKQGKSIIIENANDIGENQLNALPSMIGGDVVLIHPSLTGQADKMFLYSAGLPSSVGSVCHSKFKRTAGDAELQRVDTGDEIFLDDSGTIQPLYYGNVDVTLNSMDAGKRANMLQQFSKDLVHPELSTLAKSKVATSGKFDPQNNTKEAIVQSATGGFAFEYPCSAELKAAYECWAGVSINHLYDYNDGEEVWSEARHYAYAMYKSNALKYAAVSMHGSLNPTMTTDTDTEKAWYLQYVDLMADVRDPSSENASAGILSRMPANEADNVSITSTSGLSLSSGLDSAGLLTSGVSFDQSTSVRKDITDWDQSTRAPSSRDAGWRYEILYPGSDSDWVSTPFFQNPRYKSVPNISKNGLQYISEGVWSIDKNDDRTFYVDTTTTWQVKKRKITSRSIFHYNQSWWTRTWTNGINIWMNMGWLR